MAITEVEARRAVRRWIRVDQCGINLGCSDEMTDQSLGEGIRQAIDGAGCMAPAHRLLEAQPDRESCRLFSAFLDQVCSTRDLASGGSGHRGWRHRLVVIPCARAWRPGDTGCGASRLSPPEARSLEHAWRQAYAAGEGECLSVLPDLYRGEDIAASGWLDRHQQVTRLREIDELTLEGVMDLSRPPQLRPGIEQRFLVGLITERIPEVFIAHGRDAVALARFQSLAERHLDCVDVIGAPAAPRVIQIADRNLEQRLRARQGRVLMDAAPGGNLSLIAGPSRRVDEKTALHLVREAPGLPEPVWAELAPVSRGEVLELESELHAQGLERGIRVALWWADMGDEGIAAL